MHGMSPPTPSLIGLLIDKLEGACSSRSGLEDRFRRTTASDLRTSFIHHIHPTSVGDTIVYRPHTTPHASSYRAIAPAPPSLPSEPLPSPAHARALPYSARRSCREAEPGNLSGSFILFEPTNLESSSSCTTTHSGSTLIPALNAIHTSTYTAPRNSKENSYTSSSLSSESEASEPSKSSSTTACYLDHPDQTPATVTPWEYGCRDSFSLLTPSSSGCFNAITLQATYKSHPRIASSPSA